MRWLLTIVGIGIAGGVVGAAVGIGLHITPALMSLAVGATTGALGVLVIARRRKASA